MQLFNEYYTPQSPQSQGFDENFFDLQCNFSVKSINPLKSNSFVQIINGIKIESIIEVRQLLRVGIALEAAFTRYQRKVFF